MPNTYRRFILPMNTSSGAGGRCLAEILPNGSLRITLCIKGLTRKPLNLWIFDDTSAVSCPKTIFADRNGTLETRLCIQDSGLKKVCCVALTDSDMQAAAVGYTNQKTDWQSILRQGGKIEEAKTEAEEEISEEEFKSKVKELVSELDESLAGDKQKGEWQKISIKELAQMQKFQKYARNPFVTAEFNKYQHLICTEDEKFISLGIPCAPNERFAGAAQGFRLFKQIDGIDYVILKCEK